MKLSAVVVNRNDDYKEPKRAAFCVNSLLDTFDEVIYVDYNSPDGKGSSLNNFIDDIPKTNKLKHIVIPPYVHHLATNIWGSDSQVCNEVLAKNIGIRRATGDWVVSTNIDVIGPEKNIFNELISTLDKNNFYIISRREAEWKEVMSYDVTDWKKLQKHLSETEPERHMCGAGQRGIIEKDCWGGDACEHEEKYPWGCTPNDVWSKINCCGDFQFAHRDVWLDIKGYEELMLGKCFTDTNIQKKAELCGYPVKVLYSPPLFHIEHKPNVEKWGGPKDGGRWNDVNYWVEHFKQGQNGKNWGFSQINFEENII